MWSSFSSCQGLQLQACDSNLCHLRHAFWIECARGHTSWFRSWRFAPCACKEQCASCETRMFGGARIQVKGITQMQEHVLFYSDLGIHCPRLSRLQLLFELRHLLPLDPQLFLRQLRAFLRQLRAPAKLWARSGLATRPGTTMRAWRAPATNTCRPLNRHALGSH